VPIKYGEMGGSIWTEYELINLCLQFEFIKKKAAGWFEFDKELVEEMGDDDLKPKHQGMSNLVSYLEDNGKITEFLVDKFKKLL
jgi:hypothetical protein